MSQGFQFSKPAFLDSLQSDPVRVNLNALGTTNRGPTAPADPEEGMMWVDTSNPTNIRLRMFLNNQFLVILNNITGGAPSQSAVDQTVHIQTAPSAAWNVVHNLGTRDLVVQTWDENDILMIPDQAAVIDEDTIQITFFQPQAGKAIVLG